MTRSLLIVPAIAALGLGACAGGADSGSAAAAVASAPLAPLLENIGDLHRDVSTDSERAQAFFDQGLRMAYAFNHAESLRSFRESARLDDDLAMAYWGEALSLGPNLNEAMPPERAPEAYAAVQEALERVAGASERERALVEALATRYSNRPDADRQALDRAYADAMGAVWDRWPDDPDIGALYADALMNTGPWDYWEADDTPRLHAARAIEVLEQVIAAYPEHPGALHLHIHAIEASDHPERALESADRLGRLMPAAGHIVHMPSHIYYRVGRYREATEANLDAIAADEDYLTQCQAQGLYPSEYYPHNVHFLYFATMMEGRSELAIESARKVAAQAAKGHMHVFLSMQELASTPYYALARFGRWDEILAEPEPHHGAFQRAMWHYARGLAFARTGDVEAGARELDSLEALVDDPSLAEMLVGFDPGSVPLGIAAATLEGELAARRGDIETALQALETAVASQDRLVYNEPESFYYPVRHSLGAVLLDAGRPAEAEAVYRRSLDTHPENGWSLLGLEQSLRAQQKTAEADTVHARFVRAWDRADVTPPASRF